MTKDMTVVKTRNKIAALGCVVVFMALVVFPLRAMEEVMEEDKEVTVSQCSTEGDITQLHSLGKITRCSSRKSCSWRSQEEQENCVFLGCLFEKVKEVTLTEDVSKQVIAMREQVKDLAQTAAARGDFSVDFITSQILVKAYKPMLLGPTRLVTLWVKKMYDVADKKLAEHKKISKEKKNLLEKKLSILRSFAAKNARQEKKSDRYLSEEEETRLVVSILGAQIEHDRASIEAFASDALLDVRMELTDQPCGLVGLACSVFKEAVKQKKWAYQKNDTPDSISSSEGSSSDDN